MLMPETNDDHDYRGNAEDKIEYKICCELSQEIGRCSEASLDPQHVSSLTFVVIYLLEQKDSCDTNEDKVL